MAKRKPKFKVGDILQVKWSKRQFGLIQIQDITLVKDEGEPGFAELFYAFSHLTGERSTGSNCNHDLRGLSVVEDLLKAKLATKAGKVLYGRK